MYLEIISIAILVILSAFFSLSEAALLSTSRLRIRHLIEKKRSGAIELKKLKENPHRLLITILVGNNIVNISASAIATELAIKLFGSNGVGISIGIMTFLLLTIGEI